MGIDVNELWNHGKPELSEQRFREALTAASPEDRLILQTQIARTFGIRKQFDRAREILSDVEPQLAQADGEGQVRYWLELGRTHCSTAHPPESQTDETKGLARNFYTRAFEIAQTERLDDLAIDALHMMTVVDAAPEDQVEWNRKAIAVMDASDQPAAKKWEGSLRNNLGYALHLLGRYDEALAEFQSALVLREKVGKPGPIRVGKWMIAWNLRAMGRLDEALETQLKLEQECSEAGEPDPYVFEELEHLYRAKGDSGTADSYAAKLQSLS